MVLPFLKDFNFGGKKVLVRCDLDVPIENGKIVDDSRIKECLPTVKYLLEQGIKEIILMGHLGRPEGKVVNELRMVPVAEKLAKLLEKELEKQEKLGGFEGYGVGDNIFLLENLRFDKREEENDEGYVKELSGLGNFYVNEAFASSHRLHASIVGIPKLLPHCAGLHFASEAESLSRVLENYKKPLVVIIGGAKTETKIPVVEGLFDKADIFLLGGVVANTFLAAEESHPKKLGRSKIDLDFIPEAKRILSLQKGEKIFFEGVGEIYKIKLPLDLVVSLEDGSSQEIISISGKTGEVFDQNKTGLDIGLETVSLYTKIISLAGTVIWNGPMGKYEDERWDAGTRKIAEAVGNCRGFRVVGGGDTIAALTKFGLLDKMDYVSTGGGAMLEFLAKGTLPGIGAIVSN